MAQKLNVSIYSFSYRKGIPEDKSGNGGGYVFDCRGILNPGRQEQFKTQTGRDAGVIEFLETETRMEEFLQGVFAVISITIEDYLNRGFQHLQISFGCTGGQHRSVYSADRTVAFLKENFPQLEATVEHVEQERKNWINEPY